MDSNNKFESFKQSIFKLVNFIYSFMYSFASIKLAGTEFFFFFFYEIWKFSFIDFVILSLKRALYCASTWTVVCNNFGRNLK